MGWNEIMNNDSINARKSYLEDWLRIFCYNVVLNSRYIHSILQTTEENLPHKKKKMKSGQSVEKTDLVLNLGQT